MRTDTKPLPGKRKSLRIEKSMVKTNSPENKLGVVIPISPELIYFDEVSEFTTEDYDKIVQLKTDMQTRIRHSGLKEYRLNNGV